MNIGEVFAAYGIDVQQYPFWAIIDNIKGGSVSGGLDSRYYDKHRTIERHPSSQKFHDFCDQMKALHDKKQADYGRQNDPFANVRATEEWGQPAWVGAMIRATDKLRRLQKAANGGQMANESVEDSFMDLAVYSIIGLVLYREAQGQPVDAPGAGLRVSE